MVFSAASAEILWHCLCIERVSAFICLQKTYFFITVITMIYTLPVINYLPNFQMCLQFWRQLHTFWVLFSVHTQFHNLFQFESSEHLCFIFLTFDLRLLLLWILSPSVSLSGFFSHFKPRQYVMRIPALVPAFSFSQSIYSIFLLSEWLISWPLCPCKRIHVKFEGTLWNLLNAQRILCHEVEMQAGSTHPLIWMISFTFTQHGTSW